MGIRDGQSDRSSSIFDQFCRATSLRGTLNIFQQLCEEIHLDRTDHAAFFPTFRAKLRSWKAVSLWNKLEKRASQEVYMNQTPCRGYRALVIGAGPCGLRTAIELAMLGCKVIVLEKRDGFSRNNVIHLWPFVIHDLRSLGAKKFYGKFCSGSIDHISIKQVQLMLTKIALLLGIEIHINVSFEDIIKPENNNGWRVSVLPTDHPVNQYEIDILIGADGRRNSLDGFPRKEFRGKLAIGITANFVNTNSKAEAQVEEISGLSYIYNQRFFQDLKLCSGIDLENIVYYKDETHYFVMTAKKTSLLAKGVLLRDHPEIASLLLRDNVNQTALLSFAREAAKAATNGQLPELEFAKNSHGTHDVAMFDFTSLFAAENASRLVTRHGHTLLMALVGDSLLEPFWPTGSGCARGFLSSLDAAWMTRQWCTGEDPLTVIAERESLYQLLSQTTPNNISKDSASFTINPRSRYQTLISTYMKNYQVRHLYDDDGTSRRKIKALEPVKTQKKFFGDYDRILRWFHFRLMPYENITQVADLSTSWYDGKGLYCILHHFHPELVDLKTINDEECIYQKACDLIETVYQVSPRVTANEISEQSADPQKMFQYLSDLCHKMAVTHRRLSENEPEKKTEKKAEKRVVHRPAQHRMLPKMAERVEKPRRPTTVMSDESKQAALDVFLQVTGAKKPEKSPGTRLEEVTSEIFHRDIRGECGSTVADVKRRLKTPSPMSPTRRYSDMPLNRPGIDELIKSMTERQEKRHLEAKEQFEKELQRIRSPNQDFVKDLAAARTAKCYFCHEEVHNLEKMVAEGCTFHKRCLKCNYCRVQLPMDAYAFKFTESGEAKFFCFQHVGMDQKNQGAVRKTLNEYENVRLRDRKSLDSPDSNPERAEFTNRRRSIIEDNSWNLRDFLYSADMEDEFASPDENEESEDDDSDDEESDSDDCVLSPTRVINNAKMNFFSLPSEPVRIDPWAFFEREMGFKLVEKKEPEVVREPSPEWDESDLNPEDSDVNPSVHSDENSNSAPLAPPIALEEADFMDDHNNSGDSQGTPRGAEKQSSPLFGDVRVEYLNKFRPRSHSDDGVIYLPRNLYGDRGDVTTDEDVSDSDNKDKHVSSRDDVFRDDVPKDVTDVEDVAKNVNDNVISNDAADVVVSDDVNDSSDVKANGDVVVGNDVNNSEMTEAVVADDDDDEVLLGAVGGVDLSDIDDVTDEVPSVKKKPARLDLAVLEKYKIKKPEGSPYLRSPLRVGGASEAGKSVKHYSIVGKSPIHSPRAKSPGTSDVNDALKLLLGAKSEKV